jgi:hypothetical protein
VAPPPVRCPPMARMTVGGHRPTLSDDDTAVSGALTKKGNFALMALFGLEAINRGGARLWASC